MCRTATPLEVALTGATAPLDRSEDRALAHAIASHVLRRMGDLDRLIDSATRQPLAHDAKARMVLRMALVQALILETPPHAVVATALPLMDGGPRRLVHGVLGHLLRTGAALPDDRGSLPEIVAERWAGTWGINMVAAAKRAIASPPPLDLTLKEPAQTGSWAERLGGTSLMPGHVRLADAAAVPSLPGFADGAWWVQDIAASLPARLFGPAAGRQVLDICAAPGGKTAQLAAAGFAVTAIDLSAKRMARLEENLSRLGLAAQAVVADARKWKPERLFDAILLDAPCSATGIFRRHPDVVHRVRQKDIDALADIQAALIDKAAGWLTPGGTLIYATCSLERSEGEGQIDAALGRHPDLVPDPIMASELPDGIAPDPAGRLRLLPGMIEPAGGLDGFFIARLRKA